MRLISPFRTRESFTQHSPTRQPSLWFIDIALKLGAQLKYITYQGGRGGGEGSCVYLPPFNFFSAHLSYIVVN